MERAHTLAPQNYKPWIVCAAVMLNNRMVATGARHYDTVMTGTIAGMARTEANYRKLVKGAEQGFIDQFGVFHTRTEAWKIASANGQIRRRCGGNEADGGTLYSENLY